MEAMSLLTMSDMHGLEIIKEAADSGNPYAMNLYGKILREGDLVDKNLTEAHRYFLLSAEQGIDEAQYYVGMSHYLGLGAKQDYRYAINWFRVAAEKGNPKAQYAMGLCYLNGYGVYKDPGFAKLWFTMSADNGYTAALIALGDMYMDLNNPERDYKESARLYKMAADARDPDAYYKIGICCLQGKGVPHNIPKAFTYFEQGTEAGNRDCIYQLGLMYEKGSGAEENPELSAELIQRAADMGCLEAKSHIDSRFSVKKHGDIIIEGDLDTPDIIAGFKGPEETGGILGLFNRKKE